jgi:hypothetical protein
MRAMSAAPLLVAGQDPNGGRNTSTPTDLQDLSERLNEVGVTVGGQPPTKDSLGALLDPEHHDLCPPVPSLDDRYCEEHLATALSSVRVAIQERATYYAAGEKYATLALSLLSDKVTIGLLAEEASTLDKKKQIAQAALDGESRTAAATADYKTKFTEYGRQLDPGSPEAIADANRQSFLAYLARGVTSGAATIPAWWTEGYRVDGLWGAADTTTEDNRKIFANKPVVDSEAMLTERATKAAFRLSRARAVADLSSIDIMARSSETRKSTLEATRAYDNAVVQLAAHRRDAAVRLLKEKEKLAKKPVFLGFEAQARQSKNRAWDLSCEAFERAASAARGIKAVYGMPVTPPPKVETLDTLELLLAWCRATARTFLPLQDLVVHERLRRSLRRSFGQKWRDVVGVGGSISLADVANLGPVLRLRDASVIAIGTGVPTSRTIIGLPTAFSDRDIFGSARQVSQEARTVAVCPQPGGTVERRQSVARQVHNRGVAGDWLIRHDKQDLGDVDDLVIELDVTYLASPIARPQL